MSLYTIVDTPFPYNGEAYVSKGLIESAFFRFNKERLKKTRDKNLANSLDFAVAPIILCWG